jgi:hypothetical protein
MRDWLIPAITIGQPAAQHQLAGGLDFVHAAEERGGGGVMQQVGLGFGFLRDPDQRLGKRIQRVLVLGLGGFDHQGFVDDQREVVCGRVEVVVHQSLGDIQSADIRSFEASLRDELVHADAVIRDVVRVPQAGGQVIRIEHRILGHVLESIRAMHGDVGIGSHKAAAETHLDSQTLSDSECGCHGIYAGTAGGGPGLF